MRFSTSRVDARKGITVLATQEPTISFDGCDIVTTDGQSLSWTGWVAQVQAPAPRCEDKTDEVAEN